jgi:hypothetical protein
MGIGLSLTPHLSSASLLQGQLQGYGSREEAVQRKAEEMYHTMTLE